MKTKLDRRRRRRQHRKVKELKVGDNLKHLAHHHVNQLTDDELLAKILPAAVVRR